MDEKININIDKFVKSLDEKLKLIDGVLEIKSDKHSNTYYGVGDGYNGFYKKSYQPIDGCFEYDDEYQNIL